MYIEKRFEALGTLNTVRLYGEESEKTKLLNLADQMKNYVCRMDDMLSVFKEGSEISKLNAMAGKGLISVSEEVWNILLLAEEYYQKTDGRFDITSGPLCQIWRNARKKRQLPCRTEIEQAESKVNGRELSLQSRQRKAGLKKKGQSVDLGGIAKGYVVKQVHSMIRNAGVKQAWLNFGGTVCVIGKERPVGIQHPMRPKGETIGSVLVCNKSVVTSGIYEQYLEIHGKKYHHILDPTTGYPADTGILSVTVIGEDAGKLDALTTSVLLCGVERGMEMIRENQAECVLILENGDIFATPGISFMKETKG